LRTPNIRQYEQGDRESNEEDGSAARQQQPEPLKERKGDAPRARDRGILLVRADLARFGPQKEERKMKERHAQRINNAIAAPVLALLVVVVLAAAGCTATRERRGAPEESGFLHGYSQLQKNPDYPASLIYFKPGVYWANYDSVQLESAGLWGNESTKLSEEDRQMLTDTLYKSLYDELSKYFKVTSKPGPNALRLRVAMTQEKGAKVGLRTITTVVPQMRLLGSAVGLAADTATTVGSATVEIEALDPATNQQVAAAVDSRAGTKVLFAKRAYQTWGDVEAACQYWSKRIAFQLARMGVKRLPGAAFPELPSETESRTF
jgi:hypothetical protein